MDQPGKRILIVDDEAPLLKMMSTYLRRLGYVVTTAHTTDSAWADAAPDAAAIDVAVLDASMRGLSSMELGLKLLGANPALFLIVASGYPVDMAAFEAACPGRVQFLHKPFTAATLALTVRRMIAGSEEAV